MKRQTWFPGSRIVEKETGKIRNDIILAAAVLIIAAVWIAVSGRNTALSESAEIVVTRDDEEIFRKKASDTPLPYNFSVEGKNGGHNVFLIDENDDGELGLRCVEADCPDKICVETGRIHSAEQPIVCLPHRITARIIKKY